MVDHVTFGRLLAFLKHLGFTTDEVRKKVRVCRHAMSDTVLMYRERLANAAITDFEFLSLHKQLTERGLISDEDFERTFGPVHSTHPRP